MRAANLRHYRELDRQIRLLNTITMYTAPEMVIRVSFVKGESGSTRVLGRPMSGKVVFREIDQELQVCANPTGLNGGLPPSKETCDQLCSWLSIKNDYWRRIVLHILMEQVDEEIEDMLAREKIGGCDPNDLDPPPLQPTGSSEVSFSSENKNDVQDQTALRNLTMSPETRQPSGGVPSKPETPPGARKETCEGANIAKISYQGYSSTSMSDLKPRELVQASKQAQSRDVVRIGARDNMARAPYAADVSHSTRPAPLLKGVKPEVRSSLQLPRHPVSSERITSSTTRRDYSYEDILGACGERTVFNLLKDILGDSIDEDIWTSELRHRASNFKQWIPEDPSIPYSDFTVPDAEGLLAAWMQEMGVDMPATWREQSGRKVLFVYHIEVKSTTKSASEPFFMSHLQMDRCKEMAEGVEPESSGRSGSNGSASKEVYVIFRVYDVDADNTVAFKQPGLEIYCDPWTMIREAKLMCQPQEWKVQHVV